VILVVGLSGAVAPLGIRADDDPAGADCSAGQSLPCNLQLGQAATGALSAPDEVNVWRLRLDGPGVLYLLLTDSTAELSALVVAADGSFTGESQRLNPDSSFLAVPEAGAGDYVLYVRGRGGDEGTVATYLLLASWRPAAHPPAVAGVAPVPPSAPPEAQVAPPTPPPAPQPPAVPQPHEPVPAPFVPAPVPHVSIPAPIVIGPLPPPPPRPPLPPSGLRATAVGWNTIRLDWTNRSENVTELFVDGTAGYHPVPAGATTTNVGGLSPDTRYCFRVTAVNEVGEATSNEACARTLDQPPGL
jgi:hypothetical protein